MSIPILYQYEVQKQIKEIIKILSRKGYKNIKLLCHDHRDIPFAATFKGYDYLYTEDVYTYLSYLKNTRLNVTFRLHSFLPCLAYGIPAIKISYDQRALSMLDTVGLSEWNINYLKDNLIDEFKNRLNNLSDLMLMRKSLQNSIWKNIHENLLTKFEFFANEISLK